MSTKNILSQKIEKLIREGYPLPQAAAIAYEKLNKNPVPFLALLSAGGKITHSIRHMKKKKNPVADKDVFMVFASICGLMQAPHRYVDVPKPILDAMVAEKFWDYDDGVTKAGKNFVKDMIKEDADIDD